MSAIIRGNDNPCFNGCDCVVQLGEERKGSEIRLLQITDMQFIDARQRRTPDRLRIDEINAWKPENFDLLCGNQIRTLVAQTTPDLIFITGDMVYGSFDDKGSTFRWFCSFMESLGVPWAPVFGNHDNESAMGVDWQCSMLENSKNCLFSRGNVSGNSNYTVGVAVGDKLEAVLHMLDSNGCSASEDASVIKQAGLYKDQLEMITDNYTRIKTAQSGDVLSFAAFHIPITEYALAEAAKGYKTDERNTYTIGIDVPAKDDDFGCKLADLNTMSADGDVIDIYRRCNIKANFVGHWHSINTSVLYEGIRWVFGLKTGQYDSHIPGQLGGTLVSVSGGDFSVRHVPSLAPYGPFPCGAKIYDGFFSQGEYIE